MDLDEKRLSKDAKSALAIMRVEFEAGRIPEKDAAYLAKAVQVTESLGWLGGIILKAAAIVAALATIFHFLNFGGQK